MKKYMVASLLEGHLFGSYWHPPGPNFDPKGHHWGHKWNLSKLLKAVEIWIYWWNLTVSIFILVLIAEMLIVSCQYHTGIP